MKETDLKPCPFCGEIPKYKQYGIEWCVECHSSECWIVPETGLCSSKEEAAEKWNIRRAMSKEKQIDTPTQNQLTNSELEQIEEMASVMHKRSREIAENPVGIEMLLAQGKTLPDDYAEALYNVGYRKQSEGEWVYHECVSSYDGAKSGYSCSRCNAFVDENVFDMDEFHKSFCGNCGAKMKGVRTNGPNDESE